MGESFVNMFLLLVLGMFRGTETGYFSPESYFLITHWVVRSPVRRCHLICCLFWYCNSSPQKIFTLQPVESVSVRLADSTEASSYHHEIQLYYLPNPKPLTSVREAGFFPSKQMSCVSYRHTPIQATTANEFLLATATPIFILLLLCLCTM